MKCDSHFDVEPSKNNSSLCPHITAPTLTVPKAKGILYISRIAILKHIDIDEAIVADPFDAISAIDATLSCPSIRLQLSCAAKSLRSPRRGKMRGCHCARKVIAVRNSAEIRFDKSKVSKFQKLQPSRNQGRGDSKKDNAPHMI